MNQFDPLEDWLLMPEIATIPPKNAAIIHADLRQGLQTLMDYIESPPQDTNLSDPLQQLRWGSTGVIGFAEADLPAAHDAYHRVFQMGGVGGVIAQETLLKLIAAAELPRSIPFWLELLDLRKTHDSFRHDRRTLALAALARLAVRQEETAAFNALHQSCTHNDPEVRGLAIYFLGRAHREADRPMSDEIIPELAVIARHDPVFGPRFQARDVLQKAGHGPPLDHPDGAYLFKVSLLGQLRIYRTIATRAHQTLIDLQIAIQDAFDWDNDHLYGFYLNGQKYDVRFAFKCPHERDRPRCASEGIIGKLGFIPGHSFLYHFDYGDDHLFDVEIVGVHVKAKPGVYPQVVEQHGRAPAQYGNRW